MDEPVKLTRKQLYELVWSKPILQLAKEFNLSDVGLAKICKRYNIPRPERGYWAKLEHGKPVKKELLPDNKNNEEIILGASFEEKNKKNISYTQQIKEKRMQYPIYQNLQHCHPIAREIKSNGWIENYRYPKLFHPEGIERKRIMVSKALRNRALLFLNSLFIYLEDRGHEVKMYHQKHDYYGRNEISPNLIINGEEIEFIIREKMTQYEKPKEHDWDSKYSYKPSGKLIFEIDSYYAKRQTWSDGIMHKLEDYLYDIILNILMAARKLKENNRTAWHQEEQRIENEKRRLEEEKLKQIELKKIGNLEAQAENWRKSQEIRKYLKASELSTQEQCRGYDEGSEYDIWLKWAYQYADQLDPLIVFNED